MQVKQVWLGVLWFGIATHAFADAANEVLWNKLSAIKSMQADFSQKMWAKKRMLSESSGTMALERPKHFRWYTEKPMPQLLVADGEQFWLYDVDLEQVTVRPQAALEGAAAGLFLGENKAQFLQDFEVTQITEGETEVFRLKATAKQANIQRITLRFMGERLVGMDLYDQLSERTAIRFQQVKNNGTLAAKLFQFTPPKGVDVVKQ